MVASLALCVTRTKFKVSLMEEKKEAQQKTEKDPSTLCTMSFLLASFSRFSSFQCLGISWRLCRDLVEQTCLPKLPDRDKCPGVSGRRTLKYPDMDLLLGASSFHCLNMLFHILLIYISLLRNFIMDLSILYEI